MNDLRKAAEALLNSSSALSSGTTIVMTDGVNALRAALAAVNQSTALRKAADPTRDIVSLLAHGSVAVGSDGEWVSIRRSVRDRAVERLLEFDSAVNQSLTTAPADREAVLERARFAAQMAGYSLERNLLAMQAACIEYRQGKGPIEAMKWIENSLDGPGLIPDSTEMDAQKFFDREVAKITPPDLTATPPQAEPPAEPIGMQLTHEQLRAAQAAGVSIQMRWSAGDWRDGNWTIYASWLHYRVQPGHVWTIEQLRAIQDAGAQVQRRASNGTRRRSPTSTIPASASVGLNARATSSPCPCATTTAIRALMGSMATRPPYAS